MVNQASICSKGYEALRQYMDSKLTCRRIWDFRSIKLLDPTRCTYFEGMSEDAIKQHFDENIPWDLAETMPRLVPTGIYHIFVPASCGSKAVDIHHKYLLAQQGIDWKASLQDQARSHNQCYSPVIIKHTEEWISQAINYVQGVPAARVNALMKAVQDRLDSQVRQEESTAAQSSTSYTGTKLTKARVVHMGYRDPENLGDYEVPDDSTSQASTASRHRSGLAKKRGSKQEIMRNFNNAMKKTCLAFSPQDPKGVSYGDSHIKNQQYKYGRENLETGFFNHEYPHLTIPDDIDNRLYSDAWCDYASDGKPPGRRTFGVNFGILARGDLLPNTNSPEHGEFGRSEDQYGNGIKWDTNGLATLAMFIPENKRAKHVNKMTDDPQTRNIRNRISSILHRIDSYHKVGYYCMLKCLIEGINLGLIDGKLPVEQRVKNLGELIATAIHTVKELDINTEQIGNRWMLTAEHTWPHDDRLLQVGSTHGCSVKRAPARRILISMPSSATAPIITTPTAADQGSKTSQGSQPETTKFQSWKPTMRTQAIEKAQQAPPRGASFIGSVKAQQELHKLGTTTCMKIAPSGPPQRSSESSNLETRSKASRGLVSSQGAHDYAKPVAKFVASSKAALTPSDLNAPRSPTSARPRSRTPAPRHNVEAPSQGSALTDMLRYQTKGESRNEKVHCPVYESKDRRKRSQDTYLLRDLRHGWQAKNHSCPGMPNRHDHGEGSRTVVRKLPAMASQNIRLRSPWH